MTDHQAATLFAVALVVIALTGRKKKPTGKTNVLDTFASSVDKVVTSRIISRLPQLAAKR